MRFAGTKEMVTERLVLRRYTVEDAPSVFENWASLPEVTRYLRWTPHSDVSQTKHWVSSWVDAYADPKFLLWIVCLRETGVPIGSISVSGIVEYDESGELGYCIGSNWWGQGYMAEALHAVLKFCFETIGFHRIQGMHSIENPASGRVMEKAGMKAEAQLHQAYKCSAYGFQDALLYYILNPVTDE